ncbi:unnamed protein product [Clavelina lepadiformis]|uniref:Uncharacterized protein n=1 Tax=Clavelina lepadiformis TaxID=159417 RepID=A0ABP0F9R6_CLALP
MKSYFLLYFGINCYRSLSSVHSILTENHFRLVTAATIIRDFEDDMKNCRAEYERQFEQIKKEATEFTQKCNVNTEYRSYRKETKTKRCHDEMAYDERSFKELC